MALNITQKLIKYHRVSGGGSAGAPLALRIDQTGIVTLAEYSRFRGHFGSVGLGATA
jgi:hypothetical protein